MKGFTPGMPSSRLRVVWMAKRPEVAGDPAAVELFGDGGSGAGTAEAVEDEVAFIG